METKNKKLTVFLDSVGRTIIGNVVDDTAQHLVIENPALVHIQPNMQTNQLQLQILPLFFKEFQADKNNSTHWTFNKSAITTSTNVTFAEQFVAQYNQLFNVSATPASQPEVVKLFDDEETK
jgi:hypothetical protein